jgi:hypothetical protein
MNAGKMNEALAFSVAVSESLRKALSDLTQVQIRIHLGVFKTAARSGVIEDARKSQRQVELLNKVAKLTDAAVEERYFQGMYATVTAPAGVNRKARHMVLVEQVRQIAGLEGAIVECGCFRGLSSWMICQTLNEEFGPFDGTGFHIFDSFEGLSVPAAEDALTPDTKDRARLAVMMVPGGFACSEEDVRRNLAAFPGIRYRRGWLPQSLEGEEERHYRFIHLDVDLYEPTLGALEYFYPRLVPGGLILSDDYGWPGGRKAFDEFCARHQIELQILPNNQALLRKA